MVTHRALAAAWNESVNVFVLMSLGAETDPASKEKQYSENLLELQKQLKNSYSKGTFRIPSWKLTFRNNLLRTVWHRNWCWGRADDFRMGPSPIRFLKAASSCAHRLFGVLKGAARCKKGNPSVHWDLSFCYRTTTSLSSLDYTTPWRDAQAGNALIKRTSSKHPLLFKLFFL